MPVCIYKLNVPDGTWTFQVEIESSVWGIRLENDEGRTVIRLSPCRTAPAVHSSPILTRTVRHSLRRQNRELLSSIAGCFHLLHLRRLSWEDEGLSWGLTSLYVWTFDSKGALDDWHCEYPMIGRSAPTNTSARHESYSTLKTVIPLKIGTDTYRTLYIYGVW